MTETNATISGGSPPGGSPPGRFPPGGSPPGRFPPGRFPPGRYGRRRAPRRGPRWLRPVVVATLGLAVVAGGTVAAAVLAGAYGPGRAYDVTVHRFYDVTDGHVTVEFTVVVPAGEAAVCAVRARDRAGAEVGREEVRVAPAPGETRPTVAHRLRTTGRPVTGEVQRCWRAG